MRFFVSCLVFDRRHDDIKNYSISYIPEVIQEIVTTRSTRMYYSNVLIKSSDI